MADADELPEGGLAAYGDDGHDMLLALARKLVSAEQDAAEGESVESVFEQARGITSVAEALLVDEGRRAPPGRNSRCSRSWKILIGAVPSAEAIPCAHSVQTVKTQPMLDSWAPQWQDCPHRRSRTVASLSLDRNGCSTGRWSAIADWRVQPVDRYTGRRLSRMV